MPRTTPLHGCLAALGIWLASAALGEAQAAAAPAKDRALSSGLALGAAFGSEARIFGGVALYYLQLADPRMRIVLHVGAGGAPRAIVRDAWSVIGGAFFAYGKQHRLVVGISAGTQNWERYNLYRTQLASRPLWGAGLTAGYEWMSSIGLFARTVIGPSFYVAPERPLRPRRVEPGFQLGLTLGYKLW